MQRGNMSSKNSKINRRDFLKQSAATTALLSTGLSTQSIYAGIKHRSARSNRVIVIGIDGMDPILSDQMMHAGLLPNLTKLAQTGGFRRLGTSIPPQSPVAWANFINGAGPGQHGIFDFIHRDPQEQCRPFYAAAETLPVRGYWEVDDHKIQLDFWPFGHQRATTILKRRGVPFWDYLDEKGISSTFYNLPANYPPSSSKHGNHRCLAGMGTPDMLGTYGTYQHFAEDGPLRTKDDGGGKRSALFFENEKASAQLIGPVNSFLKKPQATTVGFVVHRDVKADAAAVDIQGRRLLLRQGQWSDWIQVEFDLSMPSFLPNEKTGGICRFYLQEVSPNFRLYVTPINSDPSNSVLTITEPADFIKNISNDLGLFYTTGFQEDHKALSNKIFTDAEYAAQAGTVLDERLNLLDYALQHYDDGLLFFYFSSTDMQSHMFWWDSDEKHPVRSAAQAKECFGHLKGIYRKLDSVVGDVLKRYRDQATVIVMSDHGFANFKRQFNLNSWLRANGYIFPADSSSVLRDVDWANTRAYGLGINGLYLNLKGREKHGIVEPGAEREQLLGELAAKLESLRDINGNPIILKVHRADQAYSGSATKFAPDLIVGYCRGYRASWDTCLGNMPDEILLDNDSAWSADHCTDMSQVPGIIFSNKPITSDSPSLVDLAPSILSEFGLSAPSTMTGRKILA